MYDIVRGATGFLRGRWIAVDGTRAVFNVINLDVVASNLCGIAAIEYSTYCDATHAKQSNHTVAAGEHVQVEKSSDWSINDDCTFWSSDPTLSLSLL